MNETQKAEDENEYNMKRKKEIEKDKVALNIC